VQYRDLGCRNARSRAPRRCVSTSADLPLSSARRCTSFYSSPRPFRVCGCLPISRIRPADGSRARRVNERRLSRQLARANSSSSLSFAEQVVQVGSLEAARNFSDVLMTRLEPRGLLKLVKTPPRPINASGKFISPRQLFSNLAKRRKRSPNITTQYHYHYHFIRFVKPLASIKSHAGQATCAERSGDFGSKPDAATVCATRRDKISVIHAKRSTFPRRGVPCANAGRHCDVIADKRRVRAENMSVTPRRR
jgi:hypothetical protein